MVAQSGTSEVMTLDFMRARLLGTLFVTPDQVISSAVQRSMADRAERWARGLLLDLARFDAVLPEPKRAALAAVMALIHTPDGP